MYGWDGLAVVDTNPAGESLQTALGNMAGWVCLAAGTCARTTYAPSCTHYALCRQVRTSHAARMHRTLAAMVMWRKKAWWAAQKARQVARASKASPAAAARSSACRNSRNSWLHAAVAARYWLAMGSSSGASTVWNSAPARKYKHVTA